MIPEQSSDRPSDASLMRRQNLPSYESSDHNQDPSADHNQDSSSDHNQDSSSDHNKNDPSNELSNYQTSSRINTRNINLKIDFEPAESIFYCKLV